MAFGDPIQWVVIAVVLVAVLLWGPSKIPQLARSIGLARKEFSEAQKEFQNPSEVPPQAPSPTPQATVAQPQSSSDDLLIQTAKSLGIVTEGKTREQIASEIVAKAAPKA